METTPKISVLIAHYNSGTFFTGAFESLMQQTETAWEAVIVDDASTDGSPEHVQTLISRDPRFTYLENTLNQGYAAALQRAITASGAPLFVMLDPDDALEPDALAKAVEAHEAYPEVGLVYANHLVCDGELHIQHVHRCSQITDLTAEESFLYHGEISRFASFKRSFFELTQGVHPFNKRAPETDLFLKMCEVAPVHYLNEDLYRYRTRPGSLRQHENAERTRFWYWVAAIRMAERRNLNIEDFFVKHCVRREELQVYIDREARLKKMIDGNIFFRAAFTLGQKLRLFEAGKVIGEH